MTGFLSKKEMESLLAAAVYEWTTPVLHRSGVVETDSTDPADDSGTVNTARYSQCRFDLFLDSGSVTFPMEVQVLFWNATKGKYVRGAKIQLQELPIAVIADVRGAKCFLRITALTGSSPSITIYSSLS